jgi:serine/threonine-protein kinase RsbW
MASLTLYAENENLPFLCNYAAQTGRELGLAEEEIYQLQLAVDEACANVVRHAYDGQGGHLELTIQAADDEIQVIVRDWGEPFDPQAVPPPDTAAPLEERPLGGLGLYLMKQVMDRVDYQFNGTNGNTLIMTKRPKRTNGPPKG